MPQNFRADIAYHRTRIAFYKQALEETAGDPTIPAREQRIEALNEVINDLERTLMHLEKALAQGT